MAAPDALAAFARLVDVMARLRAPGGCPWDREQTHATLRPYVLEEAYEVVDAIDRGDPDDLCDELGDLLLQVVFHAELAREGGRFTIADVATAIVEKLERRHPHVFADTVVSGAAEVVHNWKAIKAAERVSAGDARAPLDDIPRALPALAFAQKVGDRLAHMGLDWPDTEATLIHLESERREFAEALAANDPRAIRHELGDLLLTLTSVARHLDIPAELALREATTRLVRRARSADAKAKALGRELRDLDPEEQNRVWTEAKEETDAATDG